ncbi:unnamed protein product [Caenorhabditis bovis]|uniref:MITD1 C-terminal phospholipase D-like domain-containing protein n=1 Tax=Caenorhabditis bovis TaxID=2654633 RepID=A0A8S1ESR4_9PELO|nr:unnamed protein product [Caenorhabditis bovis]
MNDDIQKKINFAASNLGQAAHNEKLNNTKEALSKYREGIETLRAAFRSLINHKVILNVEYNEKLHDREITFDNGWTVKIERGLDYFHTIDFNIIGSFDTNLRPCRETNVDIFKPKR